MVRTIIVCVNYADILAHTLPYTLRAVDRVIIITNSKDKATHDVASAANGSGNVTIIGTDKFYDEGAPFNKGKGINAGLDAVCKLYGSDDWILLTDADMAITSRIDISGLDKEFLYGTKRLVCPNYGEWAKYRRDEQTLWETQNNTDKWNTGRAGYFQLFHPSASSLGPMPWYPEDSPNAGKSDYRFWRKFKDNDKVRTMPVDPGLVELHPDFHGTKQGANWEGRKTQMFGPLVNKEESGNILQLFANKENKMATVKDLHCPFRFTSAVPGQGGDTKCIGSQCAWCRGDDNKPIDSDGAGMCAINDAAGWLSSLHKLAAGKK